LSSAPSLFVPFVSFAIYLITGTFKVPRRSPRATQIYSHRWRTVLS
jgi:hypothetical protein